MGKKGYTYSAVPAPSSQEYGIKCHANDRTLRRSKSLKLFAGAAVLLAVLALAPIYGLAPPKVEGCGASGYCPDPSPHVWGQYSPFFSAPSTIDATTPTDCRLTFGLVLSRHGSRFPTASKTEAYRSLLDRVQSSVQEYGVGYEFIKDFVYGLGSDELTPLGQMELVNSGIAFLRRYQGLARDADPFIRASGSDRVVMSAQNFTQGFFDAQGRGASDPIAQILVLPEGRAFNNSLEHGSCPAFEDGPGSDIADEKEGIWSETWATPIVTRLNENLPRANLTLEETVFMMDLCPFNSVVTPNATTPGFCKLFSQDEWRGYDYFRSLGKWYGYGNGNPLGSTQGVGYVNEVIARLTGDAVRDGTTTNSTLDSSPETFPLSRKLYADFTHDNSMMSVYAALGLYNMTGDLPARHKLSPRETHGYSASWTVPFAARMYVEKMQCGHEEEELVRVLVNDRVVPLQSCGADELGRCKLAAFVDSLSFARSGGLWKTCFV
ncbi:histidine phosphatase superfamily (branch 2) domain-containing protein [Hirsutella rhossiliensis]|uniref:Phytase A n=1 Tax=Hirsutella rhossiliensis TaxID=111463 RepID=A0A9P8N0A1_9HYPO|nr:histidine phosphatase superfamily (branch 2) domain-containing protein [Hirsutella rhossiliensis]KAH0964494.1 histidine phosphatase superfamily (branch 2) domain-containing protein [Hirsutella rhossiliensis]